MEIRIPKVSNLHKSQLICSSYFDILWYCVRKGWHGNMNHRTLIFVLIFLCFFSFSFGHFIIISLISVPFTEFASNNIISQNERHEKVIIFSICVFICLLIFALFWLIVRSIYSRRRAAIYCQKSINYIRIISLLFYLPYFLNIHF